MKELETSPPHTLEELAALADLPLRTVRYYIQIGLVDRPHGETRAARYSARHLEQLLMVRKWTASGISLDRIRDLLHGGDFPVPPRSNRPGSIEVMTHVVVSEGVDLVIAPTRAALTPEQVRRLIRGVLAVHEEIAEQSINKKGPTHVR